MTPDILTRLKAAGCPSRELDAEIELALKRCDPEATYDKAEDCMIWSEPRDFGSTVAYERLGQFLPAYTGSLDAQKPLAHPDWQISSGNCNEDNAPWACVTTPDNVDHTGDGAATEELARLIALLKATEHVAAPPGTPQHAG